MNTPNPRLQSRHLADGYRAFMHRGDYSLAREHFEAAASEDPNNAEIEFFLGLCRLGTGDTKPAMEHLNAALEKGSLVKIAGDALKTTVRRFHGLEELQRVVALVNKLQPRASIEMNGLEAFVRDFKMSADYSPPSAKVEPPSDPKAVTRLARAAAHAYLEERNHALAAGQLQTLTRAYPDNDAIIWPLARCYLETDRLEPGIDCLKRCLAKGPLARSAAGAFEGAYMQAHRWTVLGFLIGRLREQLDDPEMKLEGIDDAVRAAAEDPDGGWPTVEDYDPLRGVQIEGDFARQARFARGLSALFDVLPPFKWIAGLGVAAAAIAFGAWRFVLAPAPADAAIETVGVIRSAEGSIEIRRRGDPTWRAGARGAELSSGDGLRTQANGSVAFDFSSGPGLEVESGSEINFGSIGDDGEWRPGFELEIGEILMRVPKPDPNAPAKSYYIETPLSVMLVKGTVLSVSQDAAQGTTLEVTEGEVEMWLASENESDAVDVNAGERGVVAPTATSVQVEAIRVASMRTMSTGPGIFLNDNSTIMAGVGSAYGFISIETGELLSLISYPPTSEEIYTSYLADGDPIAVHSYSAGRVLVIRSDGSPPRSLTGHTGNVLRLSGDRSGEFVVGSDDAGVVHAWNPRTGNRLWSRGGFRDGRIAKWTSADHRFLACDNPLAVADGSTHELIFLDGSDGSVVQRFIGEGVISAVAFFRNGPQALVALNDGSLRQWDLNSGSEVRSWAVEKGVIRSLIISPSGEQIMMGTGGRTAREDFPNPELSIRDLATMAKIAEFNGHTNTISDLQVSPDGRYILSNQYVPGSRDYTNTVRLWAMPAGLVDSWRNPLSNRQVASAIPLPRPILSGRFATFLGSHNGRFAPDSRRMFGGATGPAGQAQKVVWDLWSGHVLERIDLEIRAEEISYFGASWTRDGRLLATSQSDGTIAISDGETGRLIRKWSAHPEAARWLQISPSGETLLSSLTAWDITLWDVSTGTRIRSFSGREVEINGMGMSPSEDFIIAHVTDGGGTSTSGTQRVITWNAHTGQIIGDWTHESALVGMTLLHDEKRVIMRCQDDTFRVLDLLSGRELQRMSRIVDFGTQAYVMVSSDDRFFITAGTELRLWDMNTFEQLAVFRGHPEHSFRLDVSPDGRWIASGCWDGNTRIWEMPAAYVESWKSE